LLATSEDAIIIKITRIHIRWMMWRARGVRPCRGELFGAASLLNLSTLPAAQIVLAKKGLYTLLKANASPMVGWCRSTL
jgi:hypothetical protein